MKKFLLFVMTMLSAVTGAWATDGNGTFYGSSTWVISGSTLTVDVASRNDLSHWSDWDSGKPSDLTGVTKVVITGTIYSKTAEDAENGGGSDGANLGNLFKDYVLDLSGATMPTTTFWSVTGIVVGDNNNYSKNIIVPSVYASDPSSFPALQAYGAINGGINLYSINGTTLNASLGDLNNANISSVKGDCTTLKAFGFSSGSLSGIGFTYYDFTNTTLTGETTVPSGATVYVNSIEEKKYVKGAAEGNVIVRFNGNMTAAAGGSLGTNISTELGKYGQNNSPSNIETLNITGELTSTDVSWLNTNKSNLTGLATVDLSGVTFGSGVSKSTIQAALPNIVFVTYPSFCDFDGSASVTTTSSNNLQAQLEKYLISKGELSSSSTTEEKNAVLATVTSLTISGPLTSEDVTYLSKLTGLGTLDLTGATVGAGVTKSSISSAVPTGATVLYPSASTVSGCNVTINMSNALGSDMSTILTEAKAAVVAGGQSHICTLTVIGELKNADLAVLGDAAMTGATRIDLSGGTLATGASIDNLQLPSSLTSLVLPKDQTVSSVLAGKLEAAGNVNYAYSPSSDAQRLGASSTGSYDGTKNKIADYVWVVKAGGLAQAFTNEEWLRNSFYIKVASSVALNNTDVNFNALGTNKPTNYLFLDFSGSNLTPEMAANYRVTDQIGYRIILPDNWTNAQMAVFAGMDAKDRGSLAAVYSYEGSKLNILVIDNSSYNGTALRNPRIVRSGTDAIEILQGTYSAGSHPFEPCSTDNDSDGVADGIINAINNAQESIKSVIINIGATANSVGDTYTFTNPNMTYLSLEGVKSGYGTNQGATLDISGANALKTLNLKNGAFAAVTATGLTSLETVNMTGTTFNGAADFSSNSNLTTLTTASDTDFKSSLNLTGSGLTSFATSAKVTGDIYLNATPLTSLDLTTTQFQNTSSLIHIHETNDENDNNPIETLNSDGNKTISVTNNFNGVNNASPRIHPFTDIADNISEAAASGDATVTGCNDCKITYDATKGVATVHAVHAGHFAELMKTLYAGYPQGTTFKFDAACVLNLDDLKSLCGKNTDNDMNWRSNFYYVDLYDVPASLDLCKNATYENNVKTADGGVIYEWIDWMRSNDRQVKGLILPKDHTRYGSGTTLIQDGAGTNTQLATCSEFIAYYKTKDDQGNNLTQQTFVGHVYNQAPSAADAYQASYEKMLSLVDAHVKDGTSTPEVKTDADIVLISSNSATKLNSSSTSIPNATRVEIINNEMVGTQTGKASVYVYPNAAGTLASAKAATGLAGTPTELLQVNGAMNSDDFTALNGFTNGPRVLDLRNVTSTITKELLESLDNDMIQYILLPESMANKADVCGPNYSKLEELKAVISSTSTNCVAYVKTPGSLAEARYLATGGSIVQGTSLFSPTKVGLTSVTLKGNLNAADIGCNLTTYHTTSDGHWKNESGDQASVGLWGETGITSIDLADAVFVNKATDNTTNPVTYADMNLSWAGLANLSDIKLPTSTEMKDIPESCCEGLASLKELCIPHNYENIHNAAFLNTIIEHITTTDGKGTLVDNGPNTYTLSANVKQIGDEPATSAGLTATQTVFPQNRPVFDCYILATKTPICYKNAFPANMLYGWGGFDGTLPYCRDKYVNGTNYYCVLRFPSQESYDATVADKRDTSYDLMKKQYTDVTKVYTKKEQTGAVDANGDEIVWPTFSELRRAYNQATEGLTWNKWIATYDINHEVNGGDNIPAGSSQTVGEFSYNATDSPGNNNLGTYSFANYEGWHQFTLSQATYVEPDEVNPETREYEDAGWFTFCIPYDMTKKQVREWLGVPASEGSITCKYDNAEVTTAMMPDIRQLSSVTRHTSTGSGDKNVVTFRLTGNLYSGEAGQEVGHYLDFTRANGGASRFTTASAGGTGDSDPVLRGGIPYIIKAYKRKGEKIKSYNLGQYIMTRYGDQFKLTQACLNHGSKYYEYLGTKGGNIATLKFSKPYEEAVVVAANDAQTASYLTYNDNGTPRPYEYALVGTFWNQKLPRYCFYQSKGTWYRNTNVNTYQWSAYKCVIMAVPTKDDILYGNLADHNGQKYRENPSKIDDAQDYYKSFYPSIESGSTDKLNGTLKIVFADGRDDDDFQSSSSARYAFAFDDGIMEYDENGEEVTAIDRLDGGDIVPTDGKVYNMAGQYVGNNLNALGSGLYIVNGKKIVVK